MRGERDVHEARGARGLHHVDDGLMRRLRIGVDDDDRLLRVAGRALQHVRERLHRRERERRRAIDLVAPLRVEPDVDLARALLRRVGVRFRQRDLQLGDPLVRRRHHQEDQDDEQHVDQRDEIDLRIVAQPVAAQIHLCAPTLAAFAAALPPEGEQFASASLHGCAIRSARASASVHARGRALRALAAPRSRGRSWDGPATLIVSRCARNRRA